MASESGRRQVSIQSRPSRSAAASPNGAGIRYTRDSTSPSSAGNEVRLCYRCVRRSRSREEHAALRPRTGWLCESTPRRLAGEPRRDGCVAPPTLCKPPVRDCARGIMSGSKDRAGRVCAGRNGQSEGWGHGAYVRVKIGTYSAGARSQGANSEIMGIVSVRNPRAGAPARVLCAAGAEGDARAECVSEF